MGQPSKQAVSVQTDGNPSAGYQARPTQPVRATQAFTSRCSPTPSTAPTAAAQSVSTALTRMVSRALSPSSRKDASRRDRASAESRTHTER